MSVSRIEMAESDTDSLRRIESLVAAIGRGNLFRGEAEHFPNVTSTLYRRFRSVLSKTITPPLLQEQLARFAWKHFGRELDEYKRNTGEIVSWSGGFDPVKFSEDAIRVWSMMQHLGAATNLIDFSTDPNVALFFACSASLENDGRVLILVENHGYDLISAKWPSKRIKAQKSQFVWSPEGYVANEKIRVVNVPHELKVPVLKWLKRQSPPVSHSTMYDDMPGYVRNSVMYERALCRYYRSFRQADDSVASAREKADAGQDVTESLQGFFDAAEKMQALAKKEPWFTWAHWQLGKMYTAAQQLDKAIRAYEEALDWCTDHDPPAGETVRILVDLGIAHGLGGNDEGAGSAFERARSIDRTLADKLIRSSQERLKS